MANRSGNSSSARRARMEATASYIGAGVVGGGGVVPIPSNNIVLLTGDSRSASSETIAANSRHLNISGYEAYLGPYAGNTIAWAPDQAVGGETIAQIYARRAAAFASPAGTIILLAGTNAGALSVSDQVAVFVSYLDEAGAAGKNVILFNEMPNSSDPDTYHVSLHNALSGLGAGRAHVKVVDSWSAMLKDGTTNTQKDGYSYDGIHQEVPGAQRLARLLADSYFTSAFAGFAKVAELTQDGSNSKSLNPLLTGTSGSVSGGPTGQVPTSFTAQLVNGTGVTVACSVAGGVSTLVFVGTPTVANPAFNFIQNVGVARPAFLTEAVPGKKYRLVAHVKARDVVALRNARLYGFFSKSGGTPSNFTVSTMHNNFSRLTQVVPSEGFDLDLVTEVFEVPAGWTGGLTGATINVGVGLVQNEAISATVEISNVGLIEVTV